MAERTRLEHMKWCKERAGEYLDQGDTAQAVASFISDLGKHRETIATQALAGQMLFTFDRSSVESTRKWIEGFA